MDFAWRWLCMGLAGLLVWTSSASGDESGPRPLDIYFIDVMGGAATLIVTPEKESILIDSGWPGFDDRDPRRIVHVLKDLAGCAHLDHLVTTHWHIDHFGGVAGLAKAIEIKHFWDRGLPEDNDPSLDFPDGPKADDPLGHRLPRGVERQADRAEAGGFPRSAWRFEEPGRGLRGQGHGRTHRRPF